MVKNLPANVGDARDLVQSLDQEDSLEEEMATHSSLLAWRIPWTGEPVGLQSMKYKELDMIEHTCTHVQNYSNDGYGTGGSYRCVRG